MELRKNLSIRSESFVDMWLNSSSFPMSPLQQEEVQRNVLKQ